MGTVDRSYSYHDDGVLPSEGEYGVTYLTLYSSGAGNHYDGWIWDPDQIHYSETERTYGYRNPDYPNYCWDDEVIVDLSNAQTRQETSDFAQGRLTSFNTNVSNQPIVLQDINITGLTEEEREAKATTVLFSAIPLIKDSYIHAEVEIEMKMNISSDNTDGRVRVEAFYILNDESDRTMRPHPIDHRSIHATDERNTFRFLYWNPALKHEDHNYIGVKLLCSGGTGEIGISDDPDYGDAIITMTSAGMTGDNIFTGKPVGLEIYGKSIVPGGYRLKIDDFTVLCTYDTGEVYDVTRLCTYSPVIGTKIVGTTILTAHYQGLSASMTIALALVESIQLIGLTDIYEDYALSLDDYTVLAFYETGDVMDITNDEEVTYSPAVGTVISSDTTLTATYAPTYIPGSTFQDSLQLTKHSEVATGYFYDDGLHYTSYNDGMIVITGNAEHDHGDRVYDKWYGIRECIRIPNNVYNSLPARQFDWPVVANNKYCKLKWKANGAICGFDRFTPYVLDVIGFDDVEIKPIMYKVEQLVEDPERANNIFFGLTVQQPFITSDMLKVYGNASFISDFESNPVLPCTDWSNRRSGDMSQMCAYARSLTHVNFLANWDTSRFKQIDMLFYNCLNLNDISGLTNWDVTNIEAGNAVFYGCENLRSAGALYKWRLTNCQGIAMWFKNSGLRHVQGLGNLSVGSNLEKIEHYIISFNETFCGCTSLTDLTGLENLINYENPSTKRPVRLDYTFYGCTNLENIGAVASWNTSNVLSIISMFGGCTKLKNISPASSWRTDILEDINAAFFGCDYADITVFSSWVLNACTVFYNTFGVNGSPPPLSVVPGTKDGSGLSLSVPYEKYQNGELTFSNFFRTYNPYSDVRNVVYFNYYSYRYRPAYPGVPERYTVYYADSGLFEGLDVFWIEQNTSVTSGIVSGTVVMHYVYSDRLPTWYKQMEMDAYKDYFDRYQYRNYDASGVVFSYT